MMGLYATVCANLIVLIDYAFDKRYMTSEIIYLSSIVILKQVFADMSKKQS